ncbi:MAG: RraA family protein [Lachnospiraceae bacterium]|nr:RraA family protein [Lachnospiraceae bacterium]
MKTNIGFRVYEDFERPAPELIEKFRGIPSSNIGDMLNRLSCMRPEIVPFNDKPLLGPAFTVKVPAGDNLMIHRALDLAKPGDILVIDGEGYGHRSLMGEMMLDYAVKRGIAGFVIDGMVRDGNALRNAPIPFYAIGLTPQGPYKNGPGEINVPIACGGQVVFPGDILVGDEDGIVVIRPSWAEELADEAKAKHAKELKELENRSNAADNEDMIARHQAKWTELARSKGEQMM